MRHIDLIGCIVLFAGLAVFLTISFYHKHQAIKSDSAATYKVAREVARPEAESTDEETKIIEKHQLRSLNDIWQNHQGYISVKWANYLSAYEEEFSRIRAAKRHVVLLEIGVGTGGSLQIWREYFGPEAEIIGVDINPQTCTDLKYEAGITVHCFDVTNSSEVLRVFGLYQFDVMIDDAGHTSADLVTTFETLFPKLKPGGVFAMEDIASIYATEGLKRKSTSFIEVMKDFVDMTNMYEIMWASYGLPAAITPFQREMGMWIQSISFQGNMVIVRKLPFSKSASFDVLQTGRKFAVGPGDVEFYLNTVLRRKPIEQRELNVNARV